MNHQFESLKLFYTALLVPTAAHMKELNTADFEQKDEDPLWHLGHVANDLCRVLLVPFGVTEGPANKFGDVFLGLGSWNPWPIGARPEFEELITWFEEIFEVIEELHGNKQTKLPESFKLERMVVTTTGEAWDYALFHTGLHIGRVHQMLDW
ncbi:MAG: hypothetical protein QNL04_15795 [SAR324 cluster bacterium]|nr:hypothetical protein [SAR324 cluster bacterium]